VTGTVSFGNYDPITSEEGYGTIPSVGSEIRAQEYRYVVGGVKSNVPSNTINSMRTPIAGVVSVTNPGAAEGGLDEEDIEETKRRGPEILRNRYRAVTIEDYEYLAKEATKAVKKVRCLPPRLITKYDMTAPGDIDKPWTYGGLNRGTGNIYVIIIPDAPLSDPTPMPSEELLQEVSDYLEEKRTVTSKLCVTYPRYLPISVTVNVNVWKQAVDNNLIPDPARDNQFKNDINEKIKKFLHPVLGGPEGKGWEIGQDITIETLFDYIKPSSDIGFISNIGLKDQPPL
jgi:predicted phage baseplate assembly protein